MICSECNKNNAVVFINKQDDNGNTLAYSFKVNSLNGSTASLTITKN